MSKGNISKKQEEIEKALLHFSRVPYRKAFIKQPYQLRHLR